MQQKSNIQKNLVLAFFILFFSILYIFIPSFLSITTIFFPNILEIRTSGRFIPGCDFDYYYIYNSSFYIPPHITYFTISTIFIFFFSKKIHFNNNIIKYFIISLFLSITFFSTIVTYKQYLINSIFLDIVISQCTPSGLPGFGNILRGEELDKYNSNLHYLSYLYSLPF